MPGIEFQSKYPLDSSVVQVDEDDLPGSTLKTREPNFFLQASKRRHVETRVFHEEIVGVSCSQIFVTYLSCPLKSVHVD